MQAADAQRLFKSFLTRMSASLRLFRDFCGLGGFSISASAVLMLQHNLSTLADPRVRPR
jgi:hypothetical protein